MNEKQKQKDLFFFVNVNINKHEHTSAMCCQHSPIISRDYFVWNIYYIFIILMWMCSMKTVRTKNILGFSLYLRVIIQQCMFFRKKKTFLSFIVFTLEHWRTYLQYAHSWPCFITMSTSRSIVMGCQYIVEEHAYIYPHT